MMYIYVYNIYIYCPEAPENLQNECVPNNVFSHVGSSTGFVYYTVYNIETTFNLSTLALFATINLFYIFSIICFHYFLQYQI